MDVYSFGITLLFIVTRCYPKYSMRNAINGVPPKIPDTVVGWIKELIIRCISADPENRPSFAEIYEIMKSNNYDMFNETKDKKLSSIQQGQKKEIEKRVLKIEAFEYQHRND